MENHRIKICISYFYQIRNFSKNILPISTCLRPPSWYGRTLYKDKRGIWNGISCPWLVPGKTCEGLCRGPKTCDEDYLSCPFLSAYYEQLKSIDFSEFLKNIEKILEEFNCDTVAFLVFEAPDNPCSERAPLQKWFRSQGIECKEWQNA